MSPSGFQGNSSSPIRELAPTVEVWSDANMEMGGAHNSRGEFTQRSWTEAELSSDPHINLLQTRAAQEGIKELTVSGDRVRLHIDNTTAAAYIKHQGGTRSISLLQELAALWEESISRNVTILTPQYISSEENCRADFLTRHRMETWEVQLEPHLFTQILDHFNLSPTLDAFASRQSTQLARYMSWYPDSKAVARDALLSLWDPTTYLFPPVPLLTKVLQKVKEEKIRAILVCPKWPTSLWWSMVLEMLVEPPYPLPYYRHSLQAMNGGPVQCYLEPLVALHISGDLLVRH